MPTDYQIEQAVNRRMRLLAVIDQSRLVLAPAPLPKRPDGDADTRRAVDACELRQDFGNGALVSWMVYRDLEWEHGLLCETCEQPFVEGDEIHVSFLSMQGETPIMGDTKCPCCWSAEAA